MKLENMLLDSALGAILVHNITGNDGSKVLSKGRVLDADSLAKIRALGMPTVYAALLEPGDVREDDAAIRLARAVGGDGIELSKPSGGRVNLYATRPGFVKIYFDELKRINELQGVTLATIPRWSYVAPKKMLATLKTIGLALPETTLRAAEEIGVVVSVAPVAREKIAIVLTGSANAREKIEQTFSPPIRARVQELGARVSGETYVDENAGAIARALADEMNTGAQMIILAGETSIMDEDDITPRGIQQAGGAIELFGAPVEPGNLLLLAYCGDVPIIGAPGCVKSRATNGVDLILPPLIAGERVTRAEVNALAEGGLLVG